jgi:hypothetical protein
MITAKKTIKHFMILKTAVCAIVCAITIPVSVRSQSISVTGTWSLLLDQTMLQAGAGSNFIDPIVSAVSQAHIDISPRSYGRTWDVYVRKQDTYWDNSLHIDIRRQPYANIIGGLTFFEVTDTDQQFFYSDLRKKTNNVQIQFQLRGASVSLTPNTYTTTIVYTLVDTS